MAQVSQLSNPWVFITCSDQDERNVGQTLWFNDSGKRPPRHHPAEVSVIDRLCLAGVPSSIQF